jgi:hypothetical protein
MVKLDDINKLTSERKFKVSIIDSNLATSTGLSPNVNYDAQVKLWKKEYGESNASAIRIYANGTVYEYYFNDLDDFNKKFSLPEELTGGRKSRKSRKNRRKSRKNRRKSSRRIRS